MTPGPTCGLWWTRRGPVGAVVDADGFLVLAHRVPRDEDEQASWLAYIEAHHGAGLELVFTDCGWEPLARLALGLDRRAWIAPRNLAVAISRAAFWRPAPLQLAAMLARFPRVAALRRRLRRAPRERTGTQLGFQWPPPEEPS